MRPSRAATEIMRSPLPTLRLVAPAISLAVLFFILLCPLASSAQEESPSLGDVARKLRDNKLQQQSQPQPDCQPGDSLADSRSHRNR